MGNLTVAWPRRAAALATMAGLVAWLLLLPVAAGSPPARAARTALSAVPSACTPVAGSASGSAEQCTGPNQYDPSSKDKTHGTPLPNPGQVTVSQTGNLVNQDVHVSWKNFTPSTASLFGSTTMEYGVMVAECRGTDPAWTDCYNSTGNPPNVGQGSRLGDADGPDNTVFNSTVPLQTNGVSNGDSIGTGQANIQVLTAAESPSFLKCDQANPCSLVIVPAQGGNWFRGLSEAPDGTWHENCSDHSMDLGASGFAQSRFTLANISENGTGTDGMRHTVKANECSWNERIVVPLHFAPVPIGSCPQATHPDFTAAGSPMLVRAFTSWQLGFCKGKNSVAAVFNSQINEPLARDFFLNGTNAIAMTTRPASSAGVHPYTYAPVAVTAADFAYNVDDPATGQPISGMRLNARLLAKLLTTSYPTWNALFLQCLPKQFGGGATGCDGNVNYDAAQSENTPFTMYNDWEFRGINPNYPPSLVFNPSTFQDGVPQLEPTVTGGNSDITYETTRWVASHPDAADFLSGGLDSFGMHVNGSYKGAQWPEEGFTSDDPTDRLQNGYVPQLTLGITDSLQAFNQDSSGSVSTPAPGQPPVFSQSPPCVPGLCANTAIVDNAAAASFLFPAAALENHLGQYVSPSSTSMTAALKDMSANPDGITQYVNQNGNVSGAYPLTMVIYAMVPTGGISKAQAAKIADFLDYVAGPGQVQGVQPGNLPPGYLPLPANLKAETVKAADQVRAQRGAGTPGGPPRPGGIASTPAENIAGNIPASGAGIVGGPNEPRLSGSGGGSGNKPRTMPLGKIHSPSGVKLPTVGDRPLAFGRPATAGLTRFALIVLLIAGGLFALGGPTSLVLSKTDGGAVIVAGLRRAGARLPVRASALRASVRFPARTALHWMRTWRKKP